VETLSTVGLSVRPLAAESAEDVGEAESAGGVEEAESAGDVDEDEEAELAGEVEESEPVEDGGGAEPAEERGGAEPAGEVEVIRPSGEVLMCIPTLLLILSSAHTFFACGEKFPSLLHAEGGAETVRVLKELDAEPTGRIERAGCAESLPVPSAPRTGKSLETAPPMLFLLLLLLLLLLAG
jgi:hypothetical protein